MGLTPKQAMFVAEYVKDRNGAQAAIRAGYAKSSATVQGSRLIANSNVRKEIDRLLLRISGKLEITAERVLMERARLAFFDARKLLNDDGTPKGLHELDDDTAAAVAGLDLEDLFERDGEGKKERIGTVKKYKLADKNASLTALEKHLGLYKDGTDIAVPLSIHLHL